ncbi:MAG TPA: hypothetical protein PK156_33715 [Polyangium sp.]|nr:hypothetical protein [Polyangium sp.]
MSDRGTAALVRTRRTPSQGAAVRTGEELPQQGELDGLHKQFEAIRIRVHGVKPPLELRDINRFEVLWSEWLLFYTNPFSRGPAAQERLVAYHNQANGWEDLLYRHSLMTTEGLPWGWFVAGALFLGAVGIATGTKKRG